MKAYSFFVGSMAAFCVLFSQDVLASKAKPLSIREVGIVYFRVLSFAGNVQFSKPLSGEFRTVKVGRLIPDGSILRVGADSQVLIEAEDNLRRVGLNVKKSRVSIRVPLIMRLGRDSFRKISMDQKFIKQFDATIRRSSDEKENILRKLSEAWKQMAALMSPENMLNKDILKQLTEALNKGKKKEDIGISIVQGKIEFLSPSDRQVLVTNNLPTDVKIMWQREDSTEIDLMNYNVFLWRQGEEKRKFGLSKGNSYRASVEKSGKYYMQVESVDEAYRSKVHVVEVKLMDQALQGQLKAIDDSRDAAIFATMSRRISALAPDRNLIWSGLGRWPIFEFEWTRPKVCNSNVVYEFIVKDKDAKQIFKRTLNSERYQWQPQKDSFGEITWQAKVIGCMAEGKKIIKLDVSTIPRSIEFVKQQHSVELFGKIAQPRFNGTIFFDSF